MSQFPPPTLRLYKAPSSQAFSAMTPLPIYSLLQKEFKKAVFTRPAHFFVIENVMFCNDTSTVFGLAHSLEEANHYKRTDTAATFYIKGVLHGPRIRMTRSFASPSPILSRTWCSVLLPSDTLCVRNVFPRSLCTSFISRSRTCSACAR
jgi:hypothetical protein